MSSANVGSNRLFPRADLLPAGAWWRMFAVVVAAGLVSLGAQISTPSMGDVPSTLQPLAVLLVSTLLGPIFGTAGVALYVIAGSLGAPIFANGGSGFGGPTSGYFVGFIVAAIVVGWGVRSVSSMSRGAAAVRVLVSSIIGIVVIYIGGLAWLTLSVGLSFEKAIGAGFTPFIVGDLLEAFVAAAIALAILLRTRGSKG